MKRCWEMMQCGRQPGGCNVERYGACLVPTLQEGICWLLAGNEAPPEVQCLQVLQGAECRKCRYFEAFHKELAQQLSPEEADVIAASWIELMVQVPGEKEPPEPFGSLEP